MDKKQGEETSTDERQEEVELKLSEITNDEDTKGKATKKEEPAKTERTYPAEYEEEEEHDDENDSIVSLDPPPSWGEEFRDGLLRFLDHPVFQVLGCINLFVVIADGALFFFLLMGWHTLCDEPSKTDCQPRNDVYNASIQALNVCFTYMALVSMPWRSTQFLHTLGWGCPYRSNGHGRDVYGLETDEIWYHVKRCKRIGILLLLLGNCFAQFINQGTRIYFNDYESQDESPGNIWTNVFFVLSFVFAAIAGFWQIYEERHIRRDNPGVFSPGPLDLLREYLQYPCKRLLKRQPASAQEQHQHDEEEGQEQQEAITPQEEEFHENEGSLLSEQERSHDHVGEEHTRFPRHSILPLDRTGMRLWAM